ncbi:hypothetical protein CYY_003957 [Polysphondylium violaceum]|uniref:FNIP repeat-containing protein n=1 Tax=Polysphondylium violaceum TaxID=133409 RepID=A0A8J4PVZ5_9MYCE|nr:hypothetical protein CYY_003957 [Polysphondylium violaceum]
MNHRAHSKSILFKQIWNNSYLRRIIRNYVVENKEIKISFFYLITNYKELALLDKEKYNILICLVIDDPYGRLMNYGIEDTKTDFVLQVFDSPHIGIVNSLEINQPTEKLMSFVEGRKLPESLVKLSLYFSDGGKCAFDYTSIPSSVTELCVQARGIREPIHSLPSSIKHISLNYYPYKILPGTLPEDLQSLETSDYYLPLGNELPKTLTKLKSYDEVGVNINNSDLPPTLKTLDLSSNIQYLTNLSFSEPMKGLVVELDNVEQLYITTRKTWITEIYFNHFTKQEIPINLFPETLTTLTLSYDFPLMPKLLPPHLTRLELYNFDKRLDANILPRSLTFLSMAQYNQRLYKGVLPPNIKNLEMRSFAQTLDRGVLPNLIKLELGTFLPLDRQPDVLPCSLLVLSLSYFNNILPNYLPNTIQHLKIHSYKEIYIKENTIPDSVRQLSIRFGVIRKMVLPEYTITRLSLNRMSQREAPFKGLIVPPSVKDLDIDIGSVPVIPPSVEKLRLQPFSIVKKGDIPKTIKLLHLDLPYDQHVNNIEPGIIPPRCTISLDGILISNNNK